MFRIFTVVFVLSTFTSVYAQDAVTMTYQGSLADAGGQAINGTRAVTFNLYAGAEGGDALWSEAHPELDVVDGHFAAVLGSIRSLTDELAGQGSLFLGVQVGDDVEMTPRMPVGGALRAQWAAVAAHARDVRDEDINPASVTVGGQQVINGAGEWVGPNHNLMGAVGPQGERGPNGARGAQGDQGDRGPRGDPGPRGDLGPAGERGPQGLLGPEGPQGQRGPQGIAGDQGLQGPAGPAGSIGQPGGAGPIGAQGPAGPAGPEGPVGAAGPVGPAGSNGAQGADGVNGADGAQGADGVNGADGAQGAAGPIGPVGPVGSAGAQGPAGPAGEMDLRLDSDGDGHADWIEVTVGTDPTTGESVPVDSDENGVADAIQGVPGVAGPEGPDGPIGPEGPVGPAGPAGPQGEPGEAGGIDVPQFDGRYGLNLGNVSAGTTESSAQQPLVIPDNNQFGVTGVIVVNEPGEAIERLSLDVEVAHPDLSHLTITLISPSETEVVIHSPEAGDGDGLNANFPRQRLPIAGTMEDFYGETTTGVWSLKIIDDTEGPLPEGEEDPAPTQLIGWSLNFNEGWDGADIYTGNELIADGMIRTRSGVEVTMGGRIELKNTSGETTLTIDGESGQLSGNGGAPFRLSCSRVRGSSNRNASITCPDGAVMVGVSCNNSQDYRYCETSQNGNSATCNCNNNYYPELTASCCRIVFN